MTIETKYNIGDEVWFQDYLFDVGYPDDWCRDSPSIISGRDRFIKAMQDESK